MKFILPLLLCPFLFYAQDTARTYLEEIGEYRNHLNQEFANPEESPLTKEDLATFEGLDFYPADPQYRVTARFERSQDAQPFEMKTTTSRKPVYEEFGKAHFELDGKPYVLHIYQSHRLRTLEEFKNHHFLPFTDLTNGNGSYGGGRFIDLEIPEGDTMVIDFNKAYNPYCAYNSRYSCPIPPAENHLETAIEAGVKADH